MRLSELYRPSLALLTDLYQLTMADAYWHSGMHEREACFHLFFRKPPFSGGYAIAAGLADAMDWLSQLCFDAEDLDYLSTLEAPDGTPLLHREFLDYLRELRFRCDVDAMPEGTVVFGQEPLVRVTGPILQCQLVETALCTIINFQTLLATKAARVCEAAEWEPVLEFGLRRAQGPDGGLAAARAAYVGGCAATSNVLAGRLYGIPVRGTHAHSWVMAFDDELAAFETWARAMPHNSIFLVDTYDSIAGVHKAIRAGRILRAQGHQMGGIRLDSGDLAALSIEARRLLDEAGFDQARIVGSGDLDEHVIRDLKARGSTVGIWGVGTRLTTAFDEPALGGVYKLAAIRGPAGEWEPRIKVSDSPEKTTVPGMLQVRRYHDGQRLLADALYDVGTPPQDPAHLFDPSDASEQRTIEQGAQSEDLLVPVIRAGAPAYAPPPLEQVRRRARRQLESLPDAVRRLAAPERYFVGLEAHLHTLRERLKAAHPHHGSA